VQRVHFGIVCHSHRVILPCRFARSCIPNQRQCLHRLQLFPELLGRRFNDACPLHVLAWQPKVSQGLLLPIHPVISWPALVSFCGRCHAEGAGVIDSFLKCFPMHGILS